MLDNPDENTICMEYMLSFTLQLDYFIFICIVFQADIARMLSKTARIIIKSQQFLMRKDSSNWV